MTGELHDLPLLISLKGEAGTSAPAALPQLTASGNAAGSPWLPSPSKPVPYPLLPVAVLHIIDPAVIPGLSDAQQVKGQETVLSQNHKVSEEASQGLDHT